MMVYDFLLRSFAQTHIILPTPKITDPGASTLATVLSVVYGIVGALTFLFLVLGGFKYVISRGDPQATAKARDTILYAVIGMAVVLSAATITHFVFGRL